MAVLTGSSTSTPIAHWLLALAGFSAMYVPSYWTAGHGLWQTDEFGHAPIIFAVALWLFWRIAGEVRRSPDQPLAALGWPLLSVGVLLYAIGRTFSISSIEFFSQPLVVTALFLLLKGPAALRVAWFAVIYLFFMVPLPASLVDAITGPLKNWISILVVEAMHWGGYPIARAGVAITVGQYQLLVADACSGLNSILSLSALGTLFMYLMARRSKVHNAVMLMAIVPTAFIANVVRVIVLVLVTYHFGDEAGQGFLHGTAGMLLILVALAVLVAVDAGLRVVCGPRRTETTSRS